MSIQGDTRVVLSKEKNWLSSILLICGWILTAICVYTAFEISEQYQYMVLLPIIYSISRTLLRKFYYQVSPGLSTYELVTFLRFTILPLTILSQGTLSPFRTSYEYLEVGTGLMVYELVFCSMVIAFYHPKHRKMGKWVYTAGNRSLILFMAIGVVLLLYISNRSLTGNMGIFSGALNENTFAQAEEASGFASILWQALWAYLFAYVIWSVYQKSETTQRKAGSAIRSSLVCLAYYLVIFTGQASISRWYVLISAIASIAWLLKLYPGNKHTILLTIGVPFVLVLFTVTIIKNVGTDALALTPMQQISNLITPGFMDVYFSGPVNVNNAIGLKQNTSIGIGSLPYDIVNNMPIVNHFVDRTYSSAALYNRYIGRTDQIIPLIGQSISWFGYVFAPLLSMLSVALFMKVDTFFHDADGIDRYCYAFFAAWCGAETVLNMTIWLSWIYIRVIPMFLLFSAVRRLTSRRQVRIMFGEMK